MRRVQDHICCALGLKGGHASIVHINFIARAILFGGLMSLTGRPELAQSIQFAIEHVTVINPGDAKSQTDRTIIVSGSTIKAMFAGNTFKRGASMRIINGHGKFVTPGLWDMHMHFRDANRDLNSAGAATCYGDLLPRQETECLGQGNDAVTGTRRATLNSQAATGSPAEGAGRSGTYTSPLTQSRWSRTANLRVTATVARFFPRFPPCSASLNPHRRRSLSTPQGPRMPTREAVGRTRSPFYGPKCFTYLPDTDIEYRKQAENYRVGC